jgi:biotin carboxyl carrier protein
MSMQLRRFTKPLLTVVFLGGLAAAGFLTRDHWLSWFDQAKGEVAAGEAQPETASKRVLLTDEAQRNLGLTAEPVKAQTYWKTIQVPGMVVDRPGQSDRCVVAPATGVVTQVLHVTGDVVQAGEVLFTVKLLSELLHQTQTELFKVAEDIKLAQVQRQRVEKLDPSVRGPLLIEVDNKIARLEVAAKAHRQELFSRGLTSAQIDKAATGTFVNEVTVAAPLSRAADGLSPQTFEVQELKVQLGQHVQVGQTLCLLANHQSLAIEGQAFPDEALVLQRTAKEGWPVEVDFLEQTTAGWPVLGQTFHVQSLGSIDPLTRTFAFLMPLENQSQIAKHNGKSQILWRFRPGQKVRLHIRVEKLDNVFVAPADAVARDGAEAFIFTQNVNTFERRPVRVLFRDRQQMVLANDGTIVPGSFVVQSAAAQLNRMTKAQSGAAVPRGYHIHADGSLHKNEDEGK